MLNVVKKNIVINEKIVEFSRGIKYIKKDINGNFRKNIIFKIKRFIGWV